MEPKALADKIYQIIDDHKGKKIEVIDTAEVTAVCDYFVIASGTSSTHLRGMADEIEKKLGEEGIRYSRISGYDSASWILIDYLDVVVHLFSEEAREYYNLEKLWGKMSAK